MAKAPKGKARTFREDLMKGEGKMNSGARRNKRANAQVSGGGGGEWARRNEIRARELRKLAEGAGLDPDSVAASGTSIFDPVLCELAYRWFCPPGGSILDPFAGGSVRGVVASHLGRKYLGIDLRPEQVAANEAQLPICGEPAPEWIVGDSIDIGAMKLRPTFDFLFSCPPYGDLEVYSDNDADLSTMAHDDFLAAYRMIVEGAAKLLKPNRFACFVVGDFRDKQGFYRNFPGASVYAFEKAGLRFYNEAILVTAAGSLPVRAKKQFESTRKLGRTHQIIQVFVKGDPRKATAAVGPVEFGEVDLGGDIDEPTGTADDQNIAQDFSGDPASRFGEIL